MEPSKPTTAARDSGQNGSAKLPPPEADPIDEAAAESFPASDPPSFTGTTATPSSDPGMAPDAGADARHSD